MLLDYQTLRGDADRSLARCSTPWRVVVFHTAVTLLVSLLLVVADYFLDRQISNTGGLSGISTRSMLMTVQAILRLTQLFFLPFWQIGYVYYAVQVARGNASGFSDLREGFRRFGPVLRLNLLLSALAVILMFLCAQLSSILFVFVTPFAASLIESEELLAGGAMDEAAMEAALAAFTEKAALPLAILFVLCLLPGIFFLFCRYRLAELWLMDHLEGGAFAAMRGSRMAMRGNWKTMLKIDLRFWWFYLLAFLISILGNGDFILESIGIEMTPDAFTVYLLFFALYLFLLLVLYGWRRNEVAVTYAHAYLNLLPTEAPEENCEQADSRSVV
ncbi:MAG: DUF975 family protein [Ruminococcaceae bacterium]|nr:DUF975 family protein [Oscillospiraceae bacterium]